MPRGWQLSPHFLASRLGPVTQVCRDSNRRGAFAWLSHLRQPLFLAPQTSPPECSTGLAPWQNNREAHLPLMPRDRTTLTALVNPTSKLPGLDPEYLSSGQAPNTGQGERGPIPPSPANRSPWGIYKDHPSPARHARESYDFLPQFPFGWLNLKVWDLFSSCLHCVIVSWSLSFLL